MLLAGKNPGNGWLVHTPYLLTILEGFVKETIERGDRRSGKSAKWGGGAWGCMPLGAAA
jgi:hypothetical protein